MCSSVHPDNATDKLDLCKKLTTHKAQAELEHTFTWPNFPTIDQLETLVRFANESGDTEMAVRILESSRNQQPPEPTEGLMLSGDARAACGVCVPHGPTGRHHRPRRPNMRKAQTNTDGEAARQLPYC